MYIIQVVGSVKVIESSQTVQDDIQSEIIKMLEGRFGSAGSFEVFVREERTQLSIKN